MRTELEALRVQNKKYREHIDSLNYEIYEYEDTVYRLESEIKDLKDSQQSLDTSTLDKQMMYEKLAQNWGRLTMSDIDAICL